MKITRTSIATGLTSKFPDLSIGKALELTNAFCTLIGDSMSAGHDIELRGVGVFKVKQSCERKGRNPRTGEAITIPAQRRVSFKASDAVVRSLKD